MNDKNQENKISTEFKKHILGTHARILVIGDLMLDEYIQGTTTRISPEAPVPILRHKSTEQRLGGAANLAANIKTLGLNVELAGIYSQDSTGEILQSKCTDLGIKLHSLVPSSQLPTISKTRIVSGNQQLIRIDREEVFKASADTLIEGEEVLLNLLDNVDWVVLSDYAKGTLQQPWLKIILRKNRQWKVYVDPKSNDWNIYRGADLISPNFKEFSEVAHVNHLENSIESELLTNTHYNIVDIANLLRHKYELGSILVTRGDMGVSLISLDLAVEERSLAREVFDVCGAGDTVLAAFCVAQIFGESLEDSMHHANIAAGIAVSRQGTAQVTQAELTEALRGRHWHRKMVSADEFVKQAKLARSQGRRVVFTNGCFDVIHRGHIQYLQEAAEKGDLLFLALNSDDSVSRLKGPSRPVNEEADRAFVLGNLATVDWICVFSSDTPESLIQDIQPDVLVKGGDYKKSEVVGGQWAKSVQIVSFVNGYSTSNTLKRLEE